MLSLHLRAPFAVFRTFTAGSFRSTADFITPSAAYGLLLNIAGIDMRLDDGKSAMTLIRPDLPRFKLALGALAFPSQHTIYQQAHNYPVGAETGAMYKEGARGSKYNITPTRRAFLAGIDAYVCMDGNNDLERKVNAGLTGDIRRTYGLPFLGDNNFLLDHFGLVTEMKAAHWYVPFAEGGLLGHVTRLSISIDRADMARTRSNLYRPTETASAEIPFEAWTEVGY